jgi:hypothetical protein
LEGVIAEHDAIRREVRLLRQLVEKTSGDHGSELVGVGAASDYSDNDDIARSIRMTVPHESESVLINLTHHLTRIICISKQFRSIL